MDRYPGVYAAQCTAVQGGLTMTLYIPQLFGDVTVVASKATGATPQAGDAGYVAFEGGDPSYPVWLSAVAGGSLPLSASYPALSSVRTPSSSSLLVDRSYGESILLCQRTTTIRLPAVAPAGLCFKVIRDTTSPVGLMIDGGGGQLISSLGTGSVQIAHQYGEAEVASLGGGRWHATGDLLSWSGSAAVHSVTATGTAVSSGASSGNITAAIRIATASGKATATGSAAATITALVRAASASGKATATGAANATLVTTSSGPWPDATNTGLAGVGLTQADLTLYTGPNPIPSGTYDKKIFNGNYQIANGATVVVTRSKLIQPAGGFIVLWVHYNSTGNSLTISDCDMDGTAAGGGAYMIGGRRITATRLNGWGADNIGIFDGDSSLTDSYLHDMGFIGPTDGSGSHPDLWEHNGGGSNMTFRHNTFDARMPAGKFATSALQINTDNGPVSNVTIDNNKFINTTGFCLYLSPMPSTTTTLTGCSVTNNIFDYSGSAYGAVYCNRPASLVGLTWSSNVDGNGNPISDPRDWPDATNTGLAGVGLSQSNLTAYTGPSTIPSGTYDRKIFTGHFAAQSGGTHVFTKCKFISTGGLCLTNWADEGGGSNSITVSDCDFDVSAGGQGSSAIGGPNLTVLRCNIWGGENGGTCGSDCLIQDSYVHDLGFWGPGDGSGSHPDGWEASNGGTNNVTLRHNRIIANTSGPFTTSAVMCGTAFGNITNYTLDNNYIDYGGFQMYLDAKNGYTISGVKVTNNTFGPHMEYNNAHVYYSGPVTISSWYGNVDSNGATISQPS